MTNLIALPSGTVLVGDYRIERVLGAGGFGVTYLAEELALGRPVTIKEYFPSDIALRSEGVEVVPRSQDAAGDYTWGLERFIEEAQTLAKFNHTNIVQLHRYFRDNKTGYMVLHFEEGQSLKGWLKALGRAPRQKELDIVLAPLLDALEMIHKADFLHRDIAPDNIIIRKSGDPVLIDFGSARGEVATRSKTISALVKPGYSPYEQYAETSKRQGPWTDIYAMGATLYHAVTGKRPPDAPSRMVKDEIVPAAEAALSSYRAGFLKAIDKALKLNIEARPQSIAAWRGDLLVPDPPRTGWGRARAKEKKLEEVEAAAANAVTEKITAPPPTVLPPPDVPAPKGSMLNILEGLRKKPAAEAEAAAAPAKPTPEPKVEAPAPPKKREAKLKPAKPPKKVEPAVPKNRALVEVKQRAPRPRPVKGSRRAWIPIAFKLLIGVGVASAAVALQDRFPRFESRGEAVPLSQTQSLQSPSRPAVVTPIAEVEAHHGAVTGMVYSEDGKWIVTAGEDATLKVWDAAYHTLIRTIELDDGRATSLALNGTRALTGHANGKTVLWDLEHAAKVVTVQRNEANIWAVTFTGDATRFATASHDWKVTLWDANQPAAPLHVFDGHENAVQALAYSPQQFLLASGGADKTVRLWDLQTLSEKRTYRGERDFVTAVAFSHSGRALAGGSLDGRIDVWSINSSRRMRSLTGHKGRISDVAFSPGEDLLASASEDGTVRVWDIRRGRILRALSGHTGGATAVAFAPDGQHLVSAGANGMMRFWAAPLAQLATD
ncbi:MAG TPA: serine/threonine-protein kinase [Hyphomicrobium sp.]|nr:serine/threonine-protein kinase [Hyphomicrobium sp.]